MLVLYEHTRLGITHGFGGVRTWKKDSRHGLDFNDCRGSRSLLWIFRGDKGINPYHGHRKDLCRVTMIYGEKKETVTGLIDTGNRLREL